MTTKKNYLRPIDFKHGRIDMTHGAGGRAAAQLIDELFAVAFDNDYLRQGHDGALLPQPQGRLVMATDGHVISPLFFPGGDIGCLSVHGTINDVAMSGAVPLYLAASFINQNPRPKGRGISPTTSRTLRGSTSFVQCPTDTVLSKNQGEIPPQGAGNNPIVIEGFRDDQIMAMIDASLKESVTA